MTLLPTLNRVKLLRNFLESAVDAKTSTPGLIIVDHEDYKKNVKAYCDMVRPPNWVFVETDAITMGDKIREVWPRVKDCKWVNLLNDDHFIRTKEWDKKLIAKLDGTNFVTCNDNWMSPTKAAGATMWSMGLLNAVGIPIYPKGMQHLFIDDTWEAIGRATGTWHVDHSVLIEHHNQLKTPGQRDDTFNKVYGDGADLTKGPHWENDQKVHVDFMTNDFPQIRNKIRKLRGQLEITYAS